MDASLDLEHVSKPLPSLDRAIADPRLRPLGTVGGASLVGTGALLSVAPVSAAWAFWSNVVAAMLAFVGVPLFCLGLAAPEPAADSPFRFGVDLGVTQRRAVAVGSLCITLAPILLAVGSLLGLTTAVLVATASVALVGSALVLTGFLAWTTRTLSGPSSAGD